MENLSKSLLLTLLYIMLENNIILAINDNTGTIMKSSPLLLRDIRLNQSVLQNLGNIGVLRSADTNADHLYFSLQTYATVVNLSKMYVYTEFEKFVVYYRFKKPDFSSPRGNEFGSSTVDYNVYFVY